MPLLPGIVKALLSLEDSPVRFERFCLALYREAEGVDLVPTSATWDRGRDGRSISISKGGREIPAVLCATITANIDAKIEADLRRLAETTATRSLIYCTSQPLSEAACDQLEAAIRAIHRGLEAIRVLGQVQLGALAERYEHVTRRFYPAEIQNIEQTLLQPAAVPTPAVVGLRLAMMTQSGDDATSLRTELTRRLVVDTLASTGRDTPAGLAKKISDQLHLSRPVSPDYMSHILSQLRVDHLTDFQDGRASLTPAGIEYAKTVPPEASTKLLEGRAAIREQIRLLSGHNLTDGHYSQVWRAIQEGLAELFYSHGASIVRMVGALLAGETSVVQDHERVLLERLGDRVAREFTDGQQRDEVRQAIIDMFCEKDTDAFEWLTQVCVVYVVMCSLGFEATSHAEITRVLQGFRFVADSDVVISLLCQREDNHEEVVRLLGAWRAIGGTLLMATPVLEEAAYHAWISTHDYAAMRDQFDKISDADARHLIGNAFVRTFRRLFLEVSGRIEWDRYINQYRGEQDRDYGRIQEVLQEEYGFARLPDPATRDDQLQERMRQFLIERSRVHAKLTAADDLDYRLLDKCRRDALLLGAVAAARAAAREAGRGGTTIILSSSTRLKEADEAFRPELGRPDAVLSLAALGCLLTLTPGVQMGLGTLRGVLFDLGLAERLTPMQRYAYRLIAGSGQYDLEWSRRVTLQRELGERLLQDARARGKPVRQLRDRVLGSEDPEYSAKILSDALDRMAVTPEVEAELTRLRAEVTHLHQELQAARRARR